MPLNLCHDAAQGKIDARSLYFQFLVRILRKSPLT
jgi:hypothetical protein